MLASDCLAGDLHGKGNKKSFELSIKRWKMSHPVLLLTSTREEPAGTSFVIQWLRLCASNAGGAVLTPGLETKTPHAPCAVLSHSVVSDSLEPRGLNPAKLLCPWRFSRQDTGVGCHALLQGIIPNQGSNSGLLHFRQILYHLSL